MKHPFPYILLLVAALALFGCTDEPQDDYADAPLEVGATAPWQCGRTMGTARAITDPVGTTDGSGNSSQYADADYPEWLHITMMDGTAPVSKFLNGNHPEKFLVRRTYADNDNYDRLFIAYHKCYNLSEYNGGAGGTAAPKPFYTKAQVLQLIPEANTLSDRYVDGIPQSWADEDIPTIGTTDHLTTKSLFGGSYAIERNHLFLTLGHVTALIRLHFAVDSRYSKVRYIDLRSAAINGQTITSAEHLILQDAATPVPPATQDFTHHDLFAYGYIKPAYSNLGDLIANPPTLAAHNLGTWAGAVTITTPLTFTCTYDIYDKDASFTPGSSPDDAALNAATPHLTRYNVTATNTVTLNRLSATPPISQLRAGYYYDLYITINPEYLYVLSEHDNKHITIN